MPRGGLTGNFTNKFIFGPGGDNITISTPSCIYNVTNYANLYASPQDIICKNLTISDILLPTYYVNIGGSTTPKYSTFKVICSNTLTLNTGGSIRVDGSVINSGDVSTNYGGLGYGLFGGANNSTQPYGTLGGSGSGGIGSSTIGGSGHLAYIDITNSLLENPRIHLGGAGAAGASLNAGTGGTGGTPAFDKQFGNRFQPSIWQEACLYDYQIGTPGGCLDENLTNNVFMAKSKVCGGGGGGGAGGAVGNTGGGGAGGGVCYIAADKIVMNNGVIVADGQQATTGGGGGGGGVIIIVASTIEWVEDTTSYIRASGGGGTNAGSDGRILVFTDDVVAEFTSTLNADTYYAAVKAYKAEK